MTNQPLLNICLVTTSYPPVVSGLSTHVYNLGQGLAQLGHHVSVITSGTKYITAQSLGVTCIRTPSIPNPFRRNAHVSIAVGDSAKKALSQCDIVHIHDISPLSVAANKIASQQGIPTIATHHFIPGFVTQSFYQEALSELQVIPQIEKLVWKQIAKFYRQIDAIITPTQTVANLLNPYIDPSIPVHVISNGVDTSKHRPGRSQYLHHLLGLSSQNKLLLYLGRIDSDKRLDTALKAWQLCQDLHQTNQWRFVLAGEGKAKNALKKKYSGLGQVYYPGHIPENKLSRAYNSADCYLMPSPIEAQSITTLTAAAHGLPLITCDLGAAQELVKPQQNGWIYQFDDHGLNLSRVLTELIKMSTSSLVTMGKSSRRLALGHPHKELASKTIRVYYSQLRNPQKIIRFK